MGLIDEIHDDARLAAEQFVQRLATNAPLSIAGAKFMLNGLSMGTGALDPTAAQRLIDAASDSEDFQRRPPGLRGKKASAISRRITWTSRERSRSLKGKVDEASQV